MTDYDLGPLTKRARSAAFMANDDAGGNKAVNEALIQLRIAIVKAYAGASDAQFIPGKPCACTGPNPGDAECPCLMQWKGLTPTLMMDTPKIVWHSAANGLQEEFAKIKLAKPFLHNIFQPTRPNDPLSVLGALEATVNARTEDTTKLLDAMRNALITAADEQRLKADGHHAFRTSAKTGEAVESAFQWLAAATVLFRGA